MVKREKHSETELLIRATLAGDEKAFAGLVRLYQHLAYASAFTLLKDPALAQDATQESFLTVYYQLHKLKKIEAFPAWLNRIVRYSCYRILRKRRDRDEESHAAPTNNLHDKSPDQIMEDDEQRRYVLNAINDLPLDLREIIMLFYIEEHSQKEVAEYLGISHSTVNNRLYSARQKLKGRMLEMVKDTMSDKKLPDDFAENIARIIRVQGPVIEAQVKKGGASALFDNWKPAGEESRDKPQFTVIQRDVDGRIRLICNDPGQPVKAGVNIAAFDSEKKSPVSIKNLEEAVAALSPPKAKTPQLVETGIKMVDLMCPLSFSGSVGLFGVQGVGRAILVMELFHRLKQHIGKLSVFYFMSPIEAVNLRMMIDREPNFPPDAQGPLQTAWLIAAESTNPDYAQSNDLLDSSIFFSPLISCRDLYPAIDCLYSSSNMLRAGIVDGDHRDTAKRVYDLISQARRIDYDPQFCEYVALGAYGRARQHYQENLDCQRKDLSAEDRTLLSRAHKLELFLTQPFYTAESFTGVPGKTVSLKDTIAGCRAILNGDMDDTPDENFAFTGNLADIKRKS